MSLSLVEVMPTSCLNDCRGRWFVLTWFFQVSKVYFKLKFSPHCKTGFHLKQGFVKPNRCWVNHPVSFQKVCVTMGKKPSINELINVSYFLYSWVNTTRTVSHSDLTPLRNLELERSYKSPYTRLPLQYNFMTRKLKTNFFFLKLQL